MTSNVRAAFTTLTLVKNMGKIDEAFVKELRAEFLSSPKNLLAQNVCTKYNPNEAAVQRTALQSVYHVFPHKVDSEVKPLTDQKQSGRCWIFSLLNVMRVPFCRKFNVDEFEFSPAHLFFWDKIERSNFFLQNIVSAYRKGEQPSGRLMMFFLQEPASDAGQWDMLVNLVNKYGVMPKAVFPESLSCEQAVQFNTILFAKLREYAKDLCELLEKGGSDADALSRIRDCMKTVFRMTSICLGIPPERFDWEYVDKDKKYNKISGVSPMDFYLTHVKPLFNVDDKVCIVNDPRSTSGYGRPLMIEYLGNIVGGRETLYNNQPVEVMMKAVADSIKDNEPVWFGCDVRKFFFRNAGILSTKISNHSLLFDEPIVLNMTKADRLIYGLSQMTHAMVFTAVATDSDDDLPTKFRVENSWGDTYGDKGYLIMTDDWFREFVLEVVVDKKYLSEEVLRAMDQTRVVLPPWDPMGALAR